MKLEALTDELRKLAKMLTKDAPCMWKKDLAKRYGVPEHLVEQAMHKLNLEGLVSQTQHSHCPDRGGHDKKKCWHSDYWLIRV